MACSHGLAWTTEALMQRHVSEVVPADAAELRAFMLRVLTESVPTEEPVAEEMRANVLENLAWSVEHPDDCCHLKYVRDGRIAGVVLVKRFWNLCSLFVDPAFHKQGIGRALIDSALAVCRVRNDRGEIRLNAAPDAIPFYRRLGFIEREPTRPLPPGFLAMRLPL